ncbi:MAG: hypothetical protein M1827_005569 [Pycnora praestabilis]|nr:MAG: hypothetical protein M1827_005569 [Pycnora praestabilis]
MKKLGRQSTAVASSKRPKPRSKPQKRSLNALSIASKTNPERPRLRQHRLGAAEGDEKKRTRTADAQSSKEESTRRTAKTARNGRFDELDIQAGSDSDGNEWRIGQVDSDNDSDLDSDEAMGESDEERFQGFTFRGSSSSMQNRKSLKRPRQGKKKAMEIDLDEDNSIERHSGSEVGSEDDLGEDAVDLAAMLDSSEEEYEIGTFKKRKISSQDHLEPNDSGEYDEESERGSIVNGNDSSLSISDDEEGEDDPAKHSALQSLISSMQPASTEPASNRRRVGDAIESSTPSEFGLSTSQKLTVADLLPSITDPHLRKSLKLLDPDKVSKSSSKRSGIPGKLEVPLAKRQQDRLDRTAAYAKSKETLDRWMDTVKHNRRAEHLSFPLPDFDKKAAQGINRHVTSSEAYPLNELESTIQNILLESGLATKDGKSEDDKIRAFEELQTNKLPLEEVEARRAELRKARELLFREEVRAKRIKKIKSKSYRRVYRRQRQKEEREEKDAFAAAGLVASEDEQERIDRRRAEERMGARHRESKWAKGVKESGRAAWNEDTRSGVTEMARKGEELRRRIEGKEVRNEDEDGSDLLSEDDSGEDDDSGDEDNEEANAIRLQRQLDAADRTSSAAAAAVGGARSNLSSMKFMLKAEAGRKAQNDADAVRLRRELDDGDYTSEDEEIPPLGRKKYGPALKTELRSDSANNRSEFEEKQESGDEGNAESRYDAEDIEIILNSNNSLRPSVAAKGPIATRRQGILPNEAAHIPAAKVTENPWLVAPKRVSRSHELEVSRPTIPIENKVDQPASSSNGVAEAPQVKSQVKPRQVQNASTIGDVDVLKSVVDKHGKDDHESDDSEDEQSRLPFALHNDELVRKAFAGDEIVANFEKEKKSIIEEEEDKIIDNTLPGWGNWTGDGISKKEQKRNKGRFFTKEEGIKKDQRKDKKLDRVIINEKRVKKNAKYLASNLPHPFETRQQYERSLRLPVGPEWTTKETFQGATKPRIMTKQGIIAPMQKPIL